MAASCGFGFSIFAQRSFIISRLTVRHSKCMSGRLSLQLTASIRHQFHTKLISCKLLAGWLTRIDGIVNHEICTNPSDETFCADKWNAFVHTMVSHRFLFWCFFSFAGVFVCEGDGAGAGKRWFFYTLCYAKLYEWQITKLILNHRTTILTSFAVQVGDPTWTLPNWSLC